MALLPELVWCECRMASMSQVRRPDRGDQVRLRTIGTIPGPNDSSRRQLLQQCLRIPQIARVKPFGEPAVDRSKQFARWWRLALGAPEACEADQARLEANSVAAMVAHSVARSPFAGGRRACRYQ